MISFKGQTKRKTKSYKNLPNREKHSNQITIINKTEPKKWKNKMGNQVTFNFDSITLMKIRKHLVLRHTNGVASHRVYEF